MGVDFSLRKDIESAYIIKINNNALSEEYAKNAAASCDRVGLPYKFWPAYNGTDNNIFADDAVHGQTMKLIKISNPGLHNTEIGCLLSHISLWVHCIEIDQPIVVLEHDALMLQPYTKHELLGAISYLGNHDQLIGVEPVELSPPTLNRGHNKYHYLKHSHAYSIDPIAAKNLLSVVIREGLMFPVDAFIRTDLFVVYQTGLYAHEAKENNISTIKHLNVQVTEH